MNETIKLILSLSVSGSIIAGLIFTVKPLIKNKFSKSLQYYLWMIVLVRLMLPFSFEGSAMNNAFYRQVTPVVSTTVKGAINTKNIPQVSARTSPMSTDIQENTTNMVNHSSYHQSINSKEFFRKYSLYFWLLGVILVFAANLIGYARFLKYLKLVNKRAEDEEIQLLKSLLKGRRDVKLVRNTFVTTPMLVGIVRPMIIIPDISFTKSQLKNVLLHEITHLKRFDVVIKWAVLIASSLHWFNPFMYFIKREMNRACELSCDEAAIKNLNSTEKQSYGDTLISMVAENKYPMGAIQATMSEDKKTLQERLLAIMNYGKKSKAVIVVSGLVFLAVVVCAVYLGAGIGVSKGTPPKLYISTETTTTKEAVTGTYDWIYKGKNNHADAAGLSNLKYSENNSIDATANQQLVLGTQKKIADRKYTFSEGQITMYKNGKVAEIRTVKPDSQDADLYIQAPAEAGEYIYSLKLNFEDNGTVNYGFVVRVDMMTYNLTEVAKNKTPYIGNASKSGRIAGSLPVPNKYYVQQYISLDTAKKPYGFTIFYEQAPNRYPENKPALTKGSLTEANCRKNALVVFCMIDNVDKVTFAFRDSQSDGKLDESKYNDSFTFTRASIEAQYGNLKELARNLELLEKKLKDGNGDNLSTTGNAVAAANPLIIHWLT